MQVEFALAAARAAAVAPRAAWSGGVGGTGMGATSSTSAPRTGTRVRSGHDNENGRLLPDRTHAANRTGTAAATVAMMAGMSVAYVDADASAVRRLVAKASTAAVPQGASGWARGACAGLAGGARRGAAFPDSPKKGVMTYDGFMGRREAARGAVAASVTGR